MNFKKTLKDAIRNNTKIIITGKSGWGKSEMVSQVAKELELELVDFRLSEVLPEDIVGIPKVKDDYYEYVPPKWLYEILQHPEKKYLLFLDEITQGTPEVLNICYKIFDKVTKIGNHELPNVYVVGATNYQDESNYLSELPQPLKNRACMLELDHNVKVATDYIIETKGLKKDDLLYNNLSSCINTSNPRSTEKAIDLILNNANKELITAYIGLDNYAKLRTALAKGENAMELSNLELAREDAAKGYTIYNNEKYRVYDINELSIVYNLSDEEKDILKNETLNVPVGNIAFKYTLLTDYAANHPEITGEQLIDFTNYTSFNPLSYIKIFKIKEQTMTNQFEALKFMLHKSDEELLRILCTERTLPINVMKIYRNQLPWDILKDHYRRGWLTDNKIKEFAKELGVDV